MVRIGKWRRYKLVIVWWSWELGKSASIRRVCWGQTVWSIWVSRESVYLPQ